MAAPAFILLINFLCLNSPYPSAHYIDIHAAFEQSQFPISVSNYLYAFAISNSLVCSIFSFKINPLSVPNKYMLSYPLNCPVPSCIKNKKNKVKNVRKSYSISYPENLKLLVKEYRSNLLYKVQTSLYSLSISTFYTLFD